MDIATTTLNTFPITGMPPRFGPRDTPNRSDDSQLGLTVTDRFYLPSPPAMAPPGYTVVKAPPEILPRDGTRSPDKAVEGLLCTFLHDDPRFRPHTRGANEIWLSGRVSRRLQPSGLAPYNVVVHFPQHLNPRAAIPTGGISSAFLISQSNYGDRWALLKPAGVNAAELDPDWVDTSGRAYIHQPSGINVQRIVAARAGECSETGISRLHYMFLPVGASKPHNQWFPLSRTDLPELQVEFQRRAAAAGFFVR